MRIIWANDPESGMCVMICWNLFCLVLCFGCVQEKASLSERVGFDRARASLPLLSTFKLDENGLLRLDREAWSEEPDPDADIADDEQPTGFRGIMAFNNAGNSAIDNVLNRVKNATATWSRSTSSSNTSRTARFQGDQLRGDYKVTPNSVAVNLQELQGKFRTLRLVDNEKVTRLLVISSAGCVQILRCPAGVHVGAIVEGQASSHTGASFVEVVQKDPVYFRNVLEPALRGLARLPIEPALQADMPDSQPHSFGENLKGNPLRDAKVVDAIQPLARFRLVDRRLVFNRVYGEEGSIDQDVKRTRVAAERLIDQAIAKLESKGVTGMQLGDFKRQLRVGPRLVPGRYRNTEQSLFNDVVHALKGNVRTSSRGGTNYMLGFEPSSSEGVPVSGFIEKQRFSDSLEVTGGDEQLRLAVSPEFSTIMLSTGSDLISIAQSVSPPQCTLLILGPSETATFQGTTFVSMIRNTPPESWLKVRERLASYGVGGLDVFSSKIVDAISQRLRGEVPERFDPDKARTATETDVFPLMNDAQYLQAIKDQIPEDVQKPLMKRIISLRKPKK